jgi:hypothetical protein
MSGAAASGAVAAAAAAEALRRQEEEQMTGYGPGDLEGWEFKILRSTTSRFGRPEVFRQALEEEAQAGWELVEKFDNGRIRLKRRTEWREKDAHLTGDPYRTHFGMSDARLGLLIAGIVLGFLALIATLAALLD